ncbi:TPA: hypothetical protein QFF48_001637 [Enterococcus faecium]
MSIFQFTNEFNQRVPSQKKDGSLLKFSRNKGYESIPRELAQNEKLSYEARGLLISISSYPESFKLYKSELYKRSIKNSRRKIDKCWQELIDEGYVLQFRKRDGKSFIFSYLFSMESFLLEDMIHLFEEAYEYNFHYYHKLIRKCEEQTMENFRLILPNYLTKEEEDTLIAWLKRHDEIKIESSNVQVEHSKKWDEINDSSNVQNEQPKMDCSKRTDNKLINKRFITEKSDTLTDTKNIDTEKRNNNQLLESLADILTETFLSEESLELIANESDQLEEAKQVIDILYKSKKYVQDHLDGLTIVAEYFEKPTHDMLQRYFFNKRTKELNSKTGYLYNMARNHWLQMAGLMLNMGSYPNKEKYLMKCQELFEKLNQKK